MHLDRKLTGKLSHLPFVSHTDVGVECFLGT